MKPTLKTSALSAISLPLACAAATALLTLSASAATFQWDGGAGTSNWQTNTNWNPDTGNNQFNGTFNHRLSVNGTQQLIYTAAEGNTIYANGTTGVRGLVIGSLTNGSMSITGGTFESRGDIEDVLGHDNAGATVSASLTINGGNYIKTAGTTDAGKTFTVGLGTAGGTVTSNLTITNGNFSATFLQFGQSPTFTGSVAGTVQLDGGALATSQIREGLSTGSISSTINFNGGTLRALADQAAFITTDVNNAVVQAGGAIIDSNGFDIGIAKALTAGTGSGGLTKQGGGTLTLSAANTYIGTTMITAGTLTLGHATNTLVDTGAVTVNGGTLALGTNTDTVGAVTLTSGSITGTGAGTLTGTGSAYDVRSGTISAKLGGTIGLTKTTGGTVTISSDNSVGGYTGATAVNDGTLIVNGNISTSVSTTVASGATLGGSGTVGATIISGTHSPGNSPGIISHSSLTYEDGANVIWELVANSTADRGTNFDGINVTGALTFNGVTTLGLDFDFGASAVEWQNTYWASDYTGTSGWLIYSGASSLTGFSNLGLNSPTAWLDESGDTLASIRSGASFSLFQDGNNVYLNYAAIPEPSATLLGGLGMLMLLRRRR